jgi:hypothetical protein
MSMRSAHMRLPIDDSGRFVIPERFSYAGDFTEERPTAASRRLSGSPWMPPQCID